jgi:Uma2 family endonuclease
MLLDKEGTPMTLTAEMPTKTYSVEEFMALSENGKRYELVEGELVDMGQPGEEHGRISKRLDNKLTAHVEANNLGSLYITTGFRLAPKTVRAPDLAFISASRPVAKSREAIAVAPDLAVEVISPSDKWSDIIEKVREYQTVGVRLIWLVDPYTPSVHIFHQSDVIQTILSIEAELDGEAVLPGFKVAVKSLFE